MKKSDVALVRQVLYSPIVLHRHSRSVVVITSASHAEGRRFEPGRKHTFSVLHHGRLLLGLNYAAWTNRARVVSSNLSKTNVSFN